MPALILWEYSNYHLIKPLSANGAFIKIVHLTDNSV